MSDRTLILTGSKPVALGAPALSCCGTDRGTSMCLIDPLGRPCDYQGHYLNDCPRAKEVREPFVVEVKRYVREGSRP